MADPQDLPPEVADALAKGDLIGAIKLLRQQKNVGLAEAKGLIEALQRQGNVKVSVKTNVRTVTTPVQVAGGVPLRPGLSPGEVPRGGNGAMVAAILLAVLVAIAAAAYLGLA